MAKIVIELDTSAGDTLSDVLSELGYYRQDDAEVLRDALDKATDPNAWKAFSDLQAEAKEYAKEMAETAEPDEHAPKFTAKFLSEPMTDEDGAMIVGGATPILGDMDGDRKRGEAGPGRKRRTAEQVESDRLWMQQKERGHAALAKMDEGVHDYAHSQGLPRTEAEALDADAEKLLAMGADPGMTIADLQDEEDEAAETAQRADGEPTLDDLRAAIMRYNAKHGYVASIEKMREIIGCAPSDVPKDQIANAIAKVDLATTGKSQVISPPMKTPDLEPETLSLFADEPKTATKEQFNEAIKAYAKKYDGTDDFSEYGARVPTMLGDVKALFTREFGVGVVNLKTLPGGETPEALGRIVAAIKRATDENPFKRVVKS